MGKVAGQALWSGGGSSFVPQLGGDRDCVPWLGRATWHFLPLVGLQAMLHNWVRSLSGLSAWVRLQAVFSNQAIRQGHRLGSAAASAIGWVLRLPRVPVQAPGYAGPETVLNSWTGLLA